MLPGFIEYNGIKFYLQLRKDDKKWAYFYAEDNSKNCLITASGRTEQNARASLLIGILKTKLIDVSQTIIK